MEDDATRVHAMRALAGSMGLAGRSTLGDPRDRSDDEVLDLARALPILAITPTGMCTGPYDPGGAATWAVLAAWVTVPTIIAARLLGVVASRRPEQPPERGLR